jgi:hypothetical protein
MPRTFRPPQGQPTKIPIAALLTTNASPDRDASLDGLHFNVGSDINDEDEDEDEDKDPYNGEEPTTALFSMEPLVRPPGATPDVVAIPLPTVDDEGKEEKWYKYKMSWSGKVYDIEVGANDL